MKGIVEQEIVNGISWQNSQWLHQSSALLTIARSEDELKNACETFCQTAGLEYYLLIVWRPVSLVSSRVHFVSNYPERWLYDYFKEGLYKSDPIVKYCYEHASPIQWDQLIKMPVYADAAGCEVMDSAAKAGLVNGLSIPLKAPSGEVAIFNLATAKSDRVAKNLINTLPFAQLFGSRLLETYSQINQVQHKVVPVKLTYREKECLFWACEGKTAWEISKIMEVKERTVVFHLTQMIKKMGAVNRQHAIAKAIICGLIRPIP